MSAKTKEPERVYAPGERVKLVGYMTDIRHGEVVGVRCAGCYDVQVPGYAGPHIVAGKYLQPEETCPTCGHVLEGPR